MRAVPACRGFTDDRKYLWAGRLDDNRIFVFDVGADRAKPKLVNTIKDLAAKTGYVGPHTFYALPGRMLIQALSTRKDQGGATGIAVCSNQCKLVSTHDMPKGMQELGGGDGYGYHIAINPQKNAMPTSSFTGWTNDMTDIGTLIKYANAMKNFWRHDGPVGSEGHEAHQSVRRARCPVGDPLVFAVE